MNLRDFGVLYETDGHKLWMNPGDSPLILDVVRAQLNHICPPEDIQDVTTARSAFLVLESFIVDAEWNPDTRLAQYWAMRAGLSVEDKWQLFSTVLSGEDCNILFDAYNHTRLQNVRDEEPDPEKKEIASSDGAGNTQETTAPPAPQPSTANE